MFFGTLWRRRTLHTDKAFPLITNSWLDDLEDIDQGQRSQRMGHPLLIMVICAKYKKNPFRTTCDIERTQEVPYFSSWFVKSCLNDLENTIQGQRSLHETHSLLIVIICAKYKQNPFRTVHDVERARQDVTHFSSFIAKSCLNDPL